MKTAFPSILFLLASALSLVSPGSAASWRAKSDRQADQANKRLQQGQSSPNSYYHDTVATRKLSSTKKSSRLAAPTSIPPSESGDDDEKDKQGGGKQDKDENQNSSNDKDAKEEEESENGGHASNGAPPVEFLQNCTIHQVCCCKHYHGEGIRCTEFCGPQT